MAFGFSGAEPIIKLIEELHKLPGVGPKSAQRLAYHLVRTHVEEARMLADSIVAVKERILLCSECYNISEVDPCVFCTDPARNKSIICVVEEALDVIALEKTGTYKGLYHVLHGSISPINGVGPDELKIQPLIERLRTSTFAELILATNPNMEGEATAMYIQQLVSTFGLKITRPARGLPVGGDLEYTDQVTLGRAMESREEVERDNS